MDSAAGLPRFLTVGEITWLIGGSRSLVYRLVRDGEMGAVRLGKRGAIRVPRAELLRFLEARFGPEAR